MVIFIPKSIEYTIPPENIKRVENSREIINIHSKKALMLLTTFVALLLLLQSKIAITSFASTNPESVGWQLNRNYPSLTSNRASATRENEAEILEYNFFLPRFYDGIIYRVLSTK